MSIYNAFVEQMILPTSDRLLKKSIYKHFNFLKKSEWWSINDLEEYQNEKLRELIRYSYRNIEYYNHLFKKVGLSPEDIKSKDDLPKIPILKKSDIQRNALKLQNRSYPKSKTVFHKSSGSTGEPIQYIVSKDAYSFNIACNLRGWYWMGYRLGDKFIKMSQYERSSEKQIQDVFLRTRYISTSQLNSERFSEIVQMMQEFRPKIIRSYPDPLFFLANYLNKNQINTIKPEVLTTTGNLLLPSVREFVENKFETKIFDSYRCEGGPNAFENPSHDRYILSMEYGISEILANGHEVGPGEEGKHITTDLHNYAMPFIRYDSQDIVVKGTGNCPSGRNHQTLTKVYGRDSDILVTPKGKFLIVLHFADYFDKFASVNQFQIVQQRIDKVLIRLVVNSNFTNEIRNQVLNYWTNYIDDGVSVSIKIVDEIHPPKSGKRRFLIREKSIELPF
jgi:phenylacetate-CoA ligase